LPWEGFRLFVAYSRTSYRRHVTFTEACQLAFGRFCHLDKARPIGYITSKAGVPAQTLDGWKDDFLADETLRPKCRFFSSLMPFVEVQEHELTLHARDHFLARHLPLKMQSFSAACPAIRSSTRTRPLGYPYAMDLCDIEYGHDDVEMSDVTMLDDSPNTSDDDEILQ
jgi:hypothetical protein